MLRKDFFLAQIEAFTKAIAKLIFYRENGDTEQADKMLESIYSSLQVDKDFLLSHTPDEIKATLDKENTGIQQTEIAAKVLIEDSYLNNDKNKLYKAQELLLYIQQHDKTYSIERMNLLDEIRKRLNEYQ